MSAAEHKALPWWGYVHVNGSLQVKRVLDARDIEEARASSFVREVYGPFPASGREDALVALRAHADRAAIERLHTHLVATLPLTLMEDWMRARVLLREVAGI